MRSLRSLILAAALLVPATALAQQNPYYPLQGVLSDSSGNPVNGTVSVEFNLYLNETGGSSLWDETVSINFDDGLFSVYLGENSTLDPSLFADNDGLWLGVTVGSDPEMDRVFLASSPYSAYAEHAGNVDASGIVGVVQSNQINLPAAVVQGPQGCPGGSFAIGLDISGNLTCAAGPTGADFAFSDQTCTSGQVAVGIDATGSLLCEPPYTTACATGDVVTGFDGNGDPICDTLTSLLGSSGGGAVQLGSDVEVTGDLDVSGTLTVGGETFGYPSSPQYVFGNERSFCTASSNNNVGWIDFPVSFSTPPVLVMGIDESINNSGASWVRMHRLFTNRAGIRCNSNADGLDWLAMEPGVHTIDNKMVQAGIVAGPVTNGQAVFFNQVFSQPPVVLLGIDETGNQSGAVYTRIINNVSNGGFEIYADNSMDNLHYIAMDPGEYTAGRWHWYAGVAATGSGCSSNCSWSLPANMFTDSVHGVFTVNDTNNSGASYVRQRYMAPDQVNVYMNSSTENVHYVVWERQ